MKISKPFIHSVLCLTLLLSVFAVSSTTLAAPAAPDAPANGGMIGGWVTSPGGYPLPAGTLVKLFEPDGETVRGLAAPDLNNGAFQLGPTPNGLYVLKAVPPAASSYTQSLPRPVSVVNAPVNVGALALTEPQITGAVFAPDGTTPANADVLVYLGDGRVLQHVNAPAGSFKIGGLPVGGYAIQAFPAGDDPYWRSHPVPVNITHPADELVQNLTLQEADLWGVIQDSLGNPVREALVIATGANGEQTNDRSNLHGFWAIGGLADGTYQLGALPPWPDSGLLAPDPVEATLPGAANPYTLVFAAPHNQVSGTVLTNTGLPVFHAQVAARRVNQPGQAQALSDASGAYQLNLAPGLWALTVRVVEDTSPQDWVYPGAPQLVYFLPDNQPQARTQNFTVISVDASAFGVVSLPDGSTPPFTVTVGLYNDEGVGRREPIDPADGSFQIEIPNGSYKVVVHPHDAGYVGPAVDPITISPGEDYDLGNLSLLPRDAVISGTITTNSSGIEGIPVAAWRPGVPGSLHTTSGPDGAFALAVSAGTWHIQPAPGPEQPYLYTGQGQDIEMQAGGLVSDVDFELLAADATISGRLVNEAGQPVNDAHGWASAVQVGAPQVHNGAPIENGLFTIHVPAGTYRLTANFPAESPYMSTAEKQVSVAAGGTAELALTVLAKNAAISGSLWDPRNKDVVEGVAGMVSAWWGDNWAAAPVNEQNGTYRLDVAPGVWHFNFRIDPQADYARINGPLNVPVQAHQTAIVPLKIVPKDSAISGVVLAPDGSPLAGAMVLAKAASPLLQELWLQTRSGADGSFNLAVPYGRYRLGASIADPDWIKPAERMVDVPQGGVSSGHTLQFRLPDATIAGTLTVSNTLSGGNVHLWAWAEDGAFTRHVFTVTQTIGQASGPYQIGVTSGTGWHLGAVYETERQYWFGQAQVDVTTPGETAQDILLKGPFPKPAPMVVTFDAAQPQHIALADGTHIYIPAGAMPVEGQVTLRIVPVATLPHQQHASVLRYGYSFFASGPDGEPIEAHFNQDVVISFTYEDDELARQHILEQWLKPAYFSTTTNRWTFPESFVVDMDANRITMQIDHFTDYALTGMTGYSIYLPAIAR